MLNNHYDWQKQTITHTLDELDIYCGYSALSSSVIKNHILIFIMVDQERVSLNVQNAPIEVPLPEAILKLHYTMLADRRLKLPEIVAILDILLVFVVSILNDHLDIRKLPSKMGAAFSTESMAQFFLGCTCCHPHYLQKGRAISDESYATLFDGFNNDLKN